MKVIRGCCFLCQCIFLPFSDCAEYTSGWKFLTRSFSETSPRIQTSYMASSLLTELSKTSARSPSHVAYGKSNGRSWQKKNKRGSQKVNERPGVKSKYLKMKIHKTKRRDS